MTRARNYLWAALAIIAFAALLHFADRVITGWVQCEAAPACPNMMEADARSLCASGQLEVCK